MYDQLLNPTTVGDIDITHRLAMAPMTRSRSGPDGVPTELNAEYYAQRASIGLIITEGTQPSEQGQGYPTTPGVHTAEQCAGWQLVADAVHTAGGRLVIQLMHTGRIGHPDNTSHGSTPVGPSAVAADGQMFTPSGPQDLPQPDALTLDEIRTTVEDFAHAAETAIAAGADGVEIHAANGYLLHQFLSSNANRRTDDYGGSVANRIRFTVEVAAAVADRVGPGRTGIHISPGNPFNDIVENDTTALYTTLVDELAPLGLAFLDISAAEAERDLLADLRERWPGTVIVNRGDAPLDDRVADFDEGLADVVSVGKMALANPDLVERLRTGAPLNEPDPDTFYGGDHRGYTDYPTLDAVAAEAADTTEVGGDRSD